MDASLIYDGDEMRLIGVFPKTAYKKSGALDVVVARGTYHFWHAEAIKESDDDYLEYEISRSLEHAGQFGCYVETQEGQ